MYMYAPRGERGLGSTVSLEMYDIVASYPDATATSVSFSNSMPLSESTFAANQREPSAHTSLSGELLPEVFRSSTITVVAVVPMVVQSSSPLTPSFAEKYSLSPAAVRDAALLPEAPGLMSLTLTAS